MWYNIGIGAELMSSFKKIRSCYLEQRRKKRSTKNDSIMTTAARVSQKNNLGHLLCWPDYWMQFREVF
jgi:hypothetical protein